MRKSMCMFVIALVAILQSTSMDHLHSQQPTARYTGGWKATPAPTRLSPQSNTAQNSPTDTSASNPVVQTAFFQSPGGDIGLPPFPGNVSPPPNNANIAPPSLPSMPNALQANPMPNASSNLSDINTNVANVNATGQGQPQYGQTQHGQAQYGQPAPSPAYDPYATQSAQVFPPNNPYRSVAAGDNLRAVQPSQPTQNAPGNDLRPVAPSMPTSSGSAVRQVEIATGYPFVSPPPRTGNYPTSPYNSSLFRTVSYQNVVQTPVQTMPPTAAIANTQPTLPQYQAPVVANAPALNAAQYQCVPGAATYPPPGAVPGAYLPPTLTPNLTPATYTPNNSGYTPLFSLGQENYNVQIGRGIIGQPTVYVPGQPFRNFMRYLSP